MISARQFAVVLVTAPDVKVARSLANGVLRSRLAACVNIIPKIESHYWWRRNIESSAEVLVVFKTRRTKLALLEKHVLANHPYDTAEFLALPLSAGSQKYLAWLAASCQ